MKAHDFGHGYREHSVRICVAQILLAGKRELRNVLDRLYVARLYSRLIHAAAVKLNIFVNVLYRIAKPLILPRGDLIARGSFDFLLPIILHRFSYLSVYSGYIPLFFAVSEIKCLLVHFYEPFSNGILDCGYPFFLGYSDIFCKQAHQDYGSPPLCFPLSRQAKARRTHQPKLPFRKLTEYFGRRLAPRP